MMLLHRVSAALGKRLGMLAILLLCQFVHVLASAWMLVALLIGSQRAWGIAIGYDQLGNVTTGGSEDETISSRASRKSRQGRRWACILCRALDLIDKNHCAESEGQ